MCISRTLIAAWGPHEPLSRFTTDLIEKGWQVHAANDEQDFGSLDPAFRVMTGAGTVDVGNVVGRQPKPQGLEFSFIPNCFHGTVEAQVAAQLEDYPGMEWPHDGDSLAAIIADSDDMAPTEWAKAVIDKYYDRGLRFCFVCYDPCDGREAYSQVFYSAGVDETEFKMDTSQHCCALISEENSANVNDQTSSAEENEALMNLLTHLSGQEHLYEDY